MAGGMTSTRTVLLRGVCALALVLSAAAIACGQQGPRISVAEPLFDFGPVEAGAVLEHVFEIRNTGDGVLEIRSVEPT